jgi:hypothetical protein
VPARRRRAAPTDRRARAAAQDIPELNGVPSYWVNSAACIDVARNAITHKTAAGELVETGPWLREGPLSVGVTSGASTARPRPPRPAPRRPSSARDAPPHFQGSPSHNAPWMGSSA